MWPFLLSSIALIAAACGGSGGGATAAEDAAASETTSAITTDQVAEETTAETEADDAESSAVEHDVGEDDGVHDVGEDNGDHADSAGHGSEGELLTEAADGTPEIATMVQPGDPIPTGRNFVNVLGEDWRLAVDESVLFGGSTAALFGFTTDELAGSGTLLALLKIVGILPPREAGVHQEHDPIMPDSTVDLPDDLMTWFDAVPQITVLETGTATVGGDAATWYRLTVDPAAGQTFECPFGDHCAGFVVMPEGVTALEPSIDVTVWHLEAIPGVMPWVQVEDPANLEAAQQAMVTLLDGISAS